MALGSIIKKTKNKNRIKYAETPDSLRANLRPALNTKPQKIGNDGEKPSWAY